MIKQAQNLEGAIRKIVKASRRDEELMLCLFSKNLNDVLSNWNFQSLIYKRFDWQF